MQWYSSERSGAIGDVQNPHKYTSTPEDTVAATLKAGCDLECVFVA